MIGAVVVWLFGFGNDDGYGGFEGSGPHTLVDECIKQPQNDQFDFRMGFPHVLEVFLG